MGAKIVVSWTLSRPNGSPVTAYTVKATPGARTMRVAGNQARVTFLKLPHGKYTFTIRSRNAVGISAMSTVSKKVALVQTPFRPSAWRNHLAR